MPSLPPLDQFISQNYLWIALLTAWSLVWKGLALWRAGAVRHDKRWFIALLILNTAGILEIIYLFFVAPAEPEVSSSGSDIK